MTQEVIDNILIPVLAKLESLPNGASISLSELVRKTFECKHEYVEYKDWRWSLDNGTSFFDKELFDLLEPFEKAVHNLKRIYRRKETKMLK